MIILFYVFVAIEIILIFTMFICSVIWFFANLSIKAENRLRKIFLISFYLFMFFTLIFSLCAKVYTITFLVFTIVAILFFSTF